MVLKLLDLKQRVEAEQSSSKLLESQLLVKQTEQPSGRIRSVVGRSWILVELWVGQICDATSKKETKKRFKVLCFLML